MEIRKLTIPTLVTNPILKCKSPKLKKQTNQKQKVKIFGNSLKFQMVIK